MFCFDLLYDLGIGELMSFLSWNPKSWNGEWIAGLVNLEELQISRSKVNVSGIASLKGKSLNLHDGNCLEEYSSKVTKVENPKINT